MLKIWDLPTRIYHWLQAILFIGLACTGYGLAGNESAHFLFGLALFVLIIWRIGWGLVGSDTSRFANFVPSIKQLFLYLSRRSKGYLGHNPLGGLMVLLMVTLLFLQAFSGICISGAIDGKHLWGRQALKIFEQFHAINAMALIGCSTVHILAVLVYQLRGKPLIKAMITGERESSGDLTQPVLISNYKAMILLGVSISILLIIISISE
ncbi:cytochrome b/b6 domain-containing protein [Thalassomonas sp. RHCl1]|uniref:cytochrome b/b6 domain-containing protein n=1 Tax=Thalassomonas sp. RHCl1 TaxID=2995320 RepID=UPI00248ACDE8|nr:cytochrome b/b6 domain-containing protein [Thalassomonas sp. RHCl1]